MAEQQLLELASSRHGIFTHEDARSHGLSDRQIRYRVDRGRWTRITKGIYRVAGSSATWGGRIVAGCLAAGPPSAASHLAGATIWELPRFERSPAEIVVERHSSHRIPGVIVHECCLLRDEDITTRRGLPVVRPELLLIQLAGALGARGVDGVVDDVLRMKLTTLSEIHDRLDAIGRSGRDGVGILRKVLDARAPRDGRTHSKLERRFLKFVVDGQLPPPSLQHEVRDDRGVVIGHIDAAWPEAMLAVELDGREHHEPVGRWTADVERQNKLVLEGWTVLRFTWWDVHERPRSLTQRIKATLEPTNGILAAVGDT